MVNGPSLNINGTLITKSSRTFTEMFYNCQNMETHDIELNYVIDSNATITTGSGYGNSNMFYHCYKMKTSPRITRLALRDYEFYRAFDGNTKLRDVYVKFNTNTTGNALNNWLENTGSLSGIRAVHQAGSLSLPNNSTSGVPSNWLLDQGDWTTQRHARMNLYVYSFQGGVITQDWVNTVIDDPTSQSGTIEYLYFGDTLTIDNETYYVWENANSNDTEHTKLLTLTDNLYELRMECLDPDIGGSSTVQNGIILSKNWDWTYGMLTSGNNLKYDSSDLEVYAYYLVSIYRQ